MVDFKIFTSCVGTTEKFEDLLLVKMDRMDHCLSSVFLENRNKRSSWIGYIMGDGREMDSISASLKNNIEAYNANFKKLEDLDSNIIVRYNEITSQMHALTDHEHLMRDLLIAVQKYNKRDKFT